MSYCVFIPSIQPTPDRLGIADLLDGSPKPTPEFHGPNGEPGHVYVVGNEPENLPDFGSPGWKWIPARDRSGKITHSFAYRVDNPPSPADLQRTADPAGHAVELLDGNHWIVADLFAEPADDATLQALVEELRGFLQQQDWHCGYQSQVYLPGSHLLVEAALRRNYRLPFELIKTGGLSLFDLESLMHAILAAIGVTGEIEQLHYSHGN